MSDQEKTIDHIIRLRLVLKTLIARLYPAYLNEKDVKKLMSMLDSEDNENE